MRCPFCKKKARSKFFGLPTYWYCTSCELAWKKHFPKTIYDETYYKGKSSLASIFFSPIAGFFYDIRRGYVGDKKFKAWIDVGAGEGGFLKTVKAQKRIGIEISRSGREMMKDAGLEALSEKEFLRMSGINADIISFWQVLEHVENPWDYLEAAKRNLKKEGVIVIGIPNFQSFEFHWARQYWFHLQPQFHLWHFSPKSLKMLLMKNGFTIESSDYWAIEHHLTGVLQSFISKTAKSKENALHRIIKRQQGSSGTKLNELLWSLFFLTIGFPIIFIFWMVGALAKKSGTMVVVASPK